MINLLPQDNRKQLKASVMNVSLLRYVLFFVGTLLAMAASVGFIYIALLQSKSSLTNQLEESKQRALAIANIKTESEKLRQDIKNTDTIFNSQVHYSNLLTAVAKTLPSDVYILSFIISHAELAKTAPTVKTISIIAKNNDKVIETKKALEQSSYISSVSINSVTTEEKTGLIEASLQITFDKQGLAKEISWRK